MRYSIDIQKTELYNYITCPPKIVSKHNGVIPQKLNKKTSPRPHFGALELIITIPSGTSCQHPSLHIKKIRIASSGGMERFFKASKVGVGIPQWSPLIRTTPSSSEKPMAEGRRSSSVIPAVHTHLRLRIFESTKLLEEILKLKTLNCWTYISTIVILRILDENTPGSKSLPPIS